MALCDELFKAFLKIPQKCSWELAKSTITSGGVSTVLAGPGLVAQKQLDTQEKQAKKVEGVVGWLALEL